MKTSHSHRKGALDSIHVWWQRRYTIESLKEDGGPIYPHGLHVTGKYGENTGKKGYFGKEGHVSEGLVKMYYI